MHQDDPGIFSLNPSTGEISLSNLSVQVTGKLNYTLVVSAEDNLGKTPFNRANQNASVHVCFSFPFLYCDVVVAVLFVFVVCDNDELNCIFLLHRFSFCPIPQSCRLSLIFPLCLFKRKKTKLKGLLFDLRLIPVRCCLPFVFL